MIASLRHKVEVGILTPTEAMRYLEGIADSYGIRGLHLLADHYYDLAKVWARNYLYGLPSIDDVLESQRYGK